MSLKGPVFSAKTERLTTYGSEIWAEKGPLLAYVNAPLKANYSSTTKWRISFIRDQNWRWKRAPFRSRLHEQIKTPFIAQILDLYEVSPDKFAQIKVVYLLM